MPVNIPTSADLTALFERGNIVAVKELFLSLREEMSMLREELKSAEDENQKLKERLVFSDKLEFKAPLYYAQEDSTPYCPVCWERDGKAIHVYGPRTFESGRVSAECHVCNSKWNLKDPQPIQVIRPQGGRLRSLNGLL